MQLQLLLNGIFTTIRQGKGVIQELNTNTSIRLMKTQIM